MDRVDLKALLRKAVLEHTYEVGKFPPSQKCEDMAEQAAEDAIEDMKPEKLQRYLQMQPEEALENFREACRKTDDQKAGPFQELIP